MSTCHNRSLVDLSLGENAPHSCVAWIEISQGSKVKYECDKELGVLRVDRILHSSVHYPANYGFLPSTHCPDGDPLDVLVFCQEQLVPHCLAEVRPVGVLRMIDSGEEDDKILAVLKGDPDYAHYQDLTDFPPHRLKEIQRFFEDYKALENKQVQVPAIEGKRRALEIIQEAQKSYLDQQKQKRDSLSQGSCGCSCQCCSNPS